MMRDKGDIIEALELLKEALEVTLTPIDELNGRLYEVIHETPLGESEYALERIKEFFSNLPTHDCIKEIITQVEDLIMDSEDGTE